MRSRDSILRYRRESHRDESIWRLTFREIVYDKRKQRESNMPENFVHKEAIG